uniref:RING-type domain-containing protein n=1 Tax=Phytophthora ramorum TaxID=164328 RepID=H3HEA2_PHYRM
MLSLASLRSNEDDEFSDIPRSNTDQLVASDATLDLHLEDGGEYTNLTGLSALREEDSSYDEDDLVEKLLRACDPSASLYRLLRLVNEELRIVLSSPELLELIRSRNQFRIRTVQHAFPADTLRVRDPSSPDADSVHCYHGDPRLVTCTCRPGSPRSQMPCESWSCVVPHAVIVSSASRELHLDDTAPSSAIRQEMSEEFANVLAEARTAYDEIKKVLEEEEYVKALGQIIERDFFPDLPKLKRHTELLQEDDEGYPLTEMTLRAATTRGNASERDEKDEEEAGDDKLKSSMTLNRFVATHTSEDNEAFKDIQEKAVKDHQRRYHWAFDEDKDKGDPKLHLLTSGTWISKEERRIADESCAPKGPKDDRPSAPETWKFRARNPLLFPPELETTRDICRPHLGRPPKANKITVYANSRFSSEDTQLTESDSRVTSSHKDYPLVEMTPLIAPGVDASPLMTWGDIEGTPTILGSRPTPERIMNTPSFELRDKSRREKLAERLGTEAVYKAVVVGGGPAGIGVFVRAARAGLLPRLLNPEMFGTAKDNELSTQLGFKQMGVAVLHAGDATTFGGGNLGEYIINSNTFACSLLASILDEKPDLDPPESIKDTFLEKAHLHESAKRLEEIGAAPANLTEIGRFLRCVGAFLTEEIAYKAPNTSKILLNTKATKYEALENGLVRVETQASNAMGGSQELPTLDNPAYHSKLFASDACLREDGFAKLKEHILAQPAGERKVCIIKDDSETALVMPHLASIGAPVAVVAPVSPLTVTKCETAIDIMILHRSPIRCYYGSKKEAEADGADSSRVDRSGCVNTFTGLREDAKRLFKSVTVGREPRVRLFRVNQQGSQMITDKAYASAGAIVWGAGYKTNVLPGFDEAGNPLVFRQTNGIVKLNNKAQLQLLGPFKGKCPSVLGLGLGFSLRSAVDEMGSETRVDGVTVYHRRGAALVLEALFGPEVYGTSASFEEMVEKNEKKKREAQAAKEAAKADKARKFSSTSDGEQPPTSPLKSHISRSSSVTTVLTPAKLAPLASPTLTARNGSPGIVRRSPSKPATVDKKSSKKKDMAPTNPPVKLLLLRRRTSADAAATKETASELSSAAADASSESSCVQPPANQFHFLTLPLPSIRQPARMALASRRRTFCGKSHLHRLKTERASLSKLEDEHHGKPSPRPIRLLHESAMAELFQEQVHPSSRSSRQRPPSSASSTSEASLRRLLEESEEQLARALAQAEEATVDAVQLDELNTRVAAFSVASSLLRASISSSVLLGGSPDSERDDEPERADLPLLSSSAPATTGGNVAAAEGFDTSRRRECQICFDKLDALQAHVCTRWYIEYKILEGEVSQKKMVCPAPQCTRPLSEDLIEALVSPDTFAKYKKFLKNQKVGIRFCPRAGCCAVLDEPLNSSSRRVKCQVCKEESCMRCGGDFHKIPTCRRVEKRFGHWKKRHNVRACPSCKAVIEKQGGCSHMKCFQCDQEFCWSCLRPWGNHDETLCLPLSFLRSKSRKFGCWAPMRAVTKTAVVGVAAVVVVAGAGLAVVVLPPVLGFQYAKDAYRRHKYARASYLRITHGDAYLR